MDGVESVGVSPSTVGGAGAIALAGTVAAAWVTEFVRLVPLFAATAFARAVGSAVGAVAAFNWAEADPCATIEVPLTLVNRVAGSVLLAPAWLVAVLTEVTTETMPSVWSLVSVAFEDAAVLLNVLVTTAVLVKSRV